MADDLLQHSLLFMRVCVHCAVLEEQLLRTSAALYGWVGVLVDWLSHRVTAVIASRKRPVPFRTRKLSSIAPMVLHSGGCGRVGRRRTSSLGVEECLNPLFWGVRLLHFLFLRPKTVGCSRPSAVLGSRSPWPCDATTRESCHGPRPYLMVKCTRSHRL